MPKDDKYVRLLAILRQRTEEELNCTISQAQQMTALYEEDYAPALERYIRRLNRLKTRAGKSEKKPEQPVSQASPAKLKENKKKRNGN